MKNGKPVKIVLLGSLPKGDKEREESIDWKKEYVERIKKAIPNAEFLHGDLISDSVGPELVVGHDLWLVKYTDLIVVNASTKIGAGTAQEMVLAKKFQKPVVSVIPKDTHHRRSNVVFHGQTIPDWIHPFLFISSDYIAESVDDAVSWMQEYLQSSLETKDISVFEESIERFEREMQDAVQKYKNSGWQE